MNRILILPTYLKKLNCWPYLCLFHEIRDKLGFKLQFSDRIDVSSDIDELFLFGMPYHNRPELIPGFLDLNKNVKLILHTGDINCHNNKVCLSNKLKVFKRCDVILSPSYEYFLSNYPQFADKYVYLPASFDTHTQYTQLPFNNTPIMKCLLTGTISWAYPIRSFISENKIKNIKRIEKLDGYVGYKYAKLLNSYFCCVTSSGVSRVALSKFFEIPATGSLLLTDTIDDMDRLGFIPDQHYVSITKKNVFSKIQHCLSHPDQYEYIRREGMKFIIKNHSVINRIEQLKEVLGK